MGNKLLTSSLIWLGLAALCAPAVAENAPGITDTEIKIGQTMPYTGPVTAFSTLGKGEIAYFKMINEQGGINGRKINLLSLDDGYAPPRAVEQTRRLVEQDGVAFIFSSIGAAVNAATQKYLNTNKVPQVYIGSGALGSAITRNIRGPSAASRGRPRRSPRLCALPPQGEAERQARRPLSERRLRP